MQILATGGAGYVGSTVVRSLIAAGHKPLVYDNLTTGHRAAVPADCLIEGDLADADNLRKLLKSRHFDAVLHFAASIAVGESVINPRLYYHNNVANSLNLLEVMVDCQVQRILFSSTAAVYAPLSSGLLTEDSPLSPASPYAVTKYTIERMIQDFSAAYGISYTILRYFNASGADPDGRFGEAHEPETHLIPLVLQVPLGQRDKITVFGRDYDTPDGTCIRDYIHVDDLADAHIRALEAMQDSGEGDVSASYKPGLPMEGDSNSNVSAGPNDSSKIGPGEGRIYNIGTSRGHSVLEVIKAAEAVVGREIPVEFAGRREGDVTQLVAGAENINRQLGWQPRYQDLRQIIATAWRWHSTHPNGYAK